MVHLQISLDRAQAEYLRQEAAKLDVSRVEIIRRAIDKWMRDASAGRRTTLHMEREAAE